MVTAYNCESHFFSISSKKPNSEASKSQNSSHWLILKSEFVYVLFHPLWTVSAKGIHPCANVLHAGPASGGLVSWTEQILTLGFGKLFPWGAECKLVVLEAASVGTWGLLRARARCHTGRALLGPQPPTQGHLHPWCSPSPLMLVNKGCHSSTLSSPQQLTAPSGQSLLRMF